MTRLFVSIAAVVFLSATAREARCQQAFYSVTPCRLVDTRFGYGGVVSASTVRSFTAKGVCGIPGTAKSVMLNLTIVGPSADGFVTVWPAGLAFPGVSTINFSAGTPALANGLVVGLASGVPDLSLTYGTATGSGSVNVVLDVTGYLQ